MPRINLKPIQQNRNVSINYTEAQKIYNSTVWKRLRLRKLLDNPLCEDCQSKGIIKPAVEIHHIIPFMQGINKQSRLRLAYDYDNLISLCSDCHNKRHGKLNN
jgi:5-methylcytosine-specific restriction protein A